MRCLRLAATVVIGIGLVVTQPAVARELSSTQATPSIVGTTYAAFWVDVSGSTNPVLAGTELRYALSIQNSGPSDAQAVVLRDLISDHTTFLSFTQDSGPVFILTTLPAGTAGPATVSATIATLAAGDRATFTLVVNVDSDTADGTILSNTLNVDSPTGCSPDPTVRCGSLATGPRAPHRSDTEGTRVSTSSADVAVGITDAPDPVRAGGDLTYVISLVNNGPHGATGIVLRDELSRQTTFQSWTQSSGPVFELWEGYCCGGGSVRAFGQLGAGESATFTLVVRVNADVAAGTMIENSATTYAHESDPVPANGGATSTTETVAESPPG